jgi:hypothetical protein
MERDGCRTNLSENIYQRNNTLKEQRVAKRRQAISPTL